jgi:hypothetical protein
MMDNLPAGSLPLTTAKAEEKVGGVVISAVGVLSESWPRDGTGEGVLREASTSMADDDRESGDGWFVKESMVELMKKK